MKRPEFRNVVKTRMGIPIKPPAFILVGRQRQLPAELSWSAGRGDCLPLVLLLCTLSH